MTAPLPPLHVLLLEDSEEDGLLICRELGRAYDLTTRRVQTREQTLAVLRSEEWDVVIADDSMPGYSAREALATVQGFDGDLPFIIVSGTMTEEMAVSAMRAGAHDYVWKNNLTRLGPAIARELREHESRKAKRRAEADRLRLLDRERELRAIAEAANRSKNEFLAVLSHELRTPLSAIMGWVQLLQRQPSLGPTEQKAVEVIERSSRALRRLIDDLLDLSAIVNGTVHLKRQPVDVAVLVTRAMESVAPVAVSRRLAIAATLDADCHIDGDPDRLEQVVLNLIDNAMKFSPDGARIALTLTRHGGDVQLTVRDSGSGIPPEFLSRVFDRFAQADSTPSRRHGGLGMGLAIVRHLVELHGGRVEAESGGTNEGAVFRVWLPAAMPAAAGTSAAI